VSEYGASIWCDPYRWIPEAARVLRRGGELLFLCNSPLSLLCMPDTGPVGDVLVRPQRGMRRFDWTDDDPGVEFHLGHGEMFDLLTANGFHVTALKELYAPEDAADHEHYTYVPAGWAKRWPSEEIWRARKV
ncbi:MAG: SAM-dependent methyltransferase, partial [Actinomycetota bacterium]